MIRLLWLFLIMDVALCVVVMAGDWVDGLQADRSEIWLRITIELAALAIIQAIREGKV